MDDRRAPALATLGLGTLAFNSALAVYNSWGDTGSVVFVVVADTALVLFFLFLRRLERAHGGEDDRGRIKAAVWTLTTLLIAMFAFRVAPLMPPVMGSVVWAMAVATAAAGYWALNQLALPGRPPLAVHHSAPHRMGAQYSALGLGALAFNSALAVYNSWGDTGSVAFVLLADAALALLFLCLREFERAGAGGGIRRDTGKIKAAVWALTTLLTAMFASRVAPLMPPAVAALVWAMAVATAAAGFWAFFLS
ncbi:hypothetical protein U9M48_029811 [Paspalum notatum var. saurae]|uniref:Uncharacterized protein n=1 Tax=Paspalum notatum var. saurae TaxID=547442 RepID=A0AAQ3X1Z7_PASNO